MKLDQTEHGFLMAGAIIERGFASNSRLFHRRRRACYAESRNVGRSGLG